MKSLRRFSDAGLLQAARDGRSEAFEVLYRRHLPLVLKLCRGRGVSPEVAADVTAEAFALLLERVHAADAELPDAPAGWLVTVAHRRLLDGFRRGRVESAARERIGIAAMAFSDDDAEQVERLVADVDLEARLRAALTDVQFAAIKARVLDDRSYAEIAGALGCSEALVRKRVSRGLAQVQAAMELKPR